MLDCALAIQETLQSRSKSQAVTRAIHGLSGEGLSGAPMFDFGGNFTNCATWALTLAESEDIDLINTRMVDVHRRGDLAAVGGVYMLRGQIWLRRGRLAEAEADLRTGLGGLELTNFQLAGDLMIPWLAESLMELGLIDEASSVLGKMTPIDSVPSAQIAPYALNARAQLLYLQARHEFALQSALSCRDRCAEVELHNPAAIPWRVWAALALHALDRDSEAREFAVEDLRLARQWGAPYPLGRALRINGLLHSDPSETLALLHQAVSVLEPSNARLEHAKALADLGAAIRRAGRRTEARGPLRRALELATSCGATPLAEHIRTELLATGARPRHDAQTGLESLTPSEHRIATLAAQRHTNRQIAQTLFVTPKTVEVHLGSVYRKLGITTRNDLATTLQVPPENAAISG